MTIGELRHVVPLARLSLGLRWIAGIAGALLTVYVTLALFGYVRSSSQHYAAFTFVVMFMSGVAAIRLAIDHRRAQPGYRWFWPRLGTATLGWLLSTLGGLYILWHAKRLEVAAPYFDNFDMAGGLL